MDQQPKKQYHPPGVPWHSYGLVTLVLLFSLAYLGLFAFALLAKEDKLESVEQVVIKAYLLKDGGLRELTQDGENFHDGDRVLFFALPALDGVLYQSPVDVQGYPLVSFPEIVLKARKIPAESVYTFVREFYFDESKNQSIALVFCPGTAKISPFKLEQSFKSSQDCKNTVFRIKNL